MRRYTGLRTIQVTALLVCAAADPSVGATIHGHGRFERIKGKPHMGYVELYETNLFVSPSSSSPEGPARRLGTTCQQGDTCNTSIVTGDGCYCVDGLPAGVYSILMNQPLFFVAPKVVPEIQLQGNQTVVVNPELPLDYSTYFKQDGQWTGGEPRWLQTFVATGSSIRGVSFVLAGIDAPGGKGAAEVSILRDNGQPNPLNWDWVGARFDRSIEVGSDNWVRFRSGEIPTIPGTRYAVQVRGLDLALINPVNIQPYKRNKDSNSYVGGQAYNSAGIPQNFDLNYTVFSDNDGTIVTMNRREVGLGYLCDPDYFATQWGQSFTAQGQALAAADVWAAGANHRWDLTFRWRVFAGGPGGPQIGPTKITKAAFQSFGAGLHGVSYGPTEVLLVPGQTYYIEFTIYNPPPDSPGFNPYMIRPPAGTHCEGGESADDYAGGMAFREGVARPNDDLSMTILEYEVVGPVIQLTPSEINRTVHLGENLPGESFTVTNVGGNVLDYAISDDAAWLSVSPTVGSTSAGEPGDTINITYSVAGLPLGVHLAHITVASAGAKNSPQILPVQVKVETVKPDFDGDRDVDMIDFGHMQACLTGPGMMQTDPDCATADFNGDGDVDGDDLGVLINCMSGANYPADKTCDD